MCRLINECVWSLCTRLCTKRGTAVCYHTVVRLMVYSACTEASRLPIVYELLSVPTMDLSCTVLAVSYVFVLCETMYDVT